MIKEHERVVLKKGIPEQGLKTGDVGTVVHIYKKGGAFEVEFLTLHGETVAIATLECLTGPAGSEKRNHARATVKSVAREGVRLLKF